MLRPSTDRLLIDVVRGHFVVFDHALVGSIPRILETNDGIAEFLQTVEQFDLGLDHDRRFRELLARVTIEDVAEAAREVLQADRASVAVAGPEPHEAEVSVA